MKDADLKMLLVGMHFDAIDYRQAFLGWGIGIQQYCKLKKLLNNETHKRTGRPD